MPHLLKLKVMHSLQENEYDEDIEMDEFGHRIDDTPLRDGYTPFCIRCLKCDHFMEEYCPGTPSFCTDCNSEDEYTIHHMHKKDDMTYFTDKEEFENIYCPHKFIGEEHKYMPKKELTCKEFKDYLKNFEVIYDD